MISAYMLKLWESGKCPALVNASIVRKNGGFVAEIREGNLSNLFYENAGEGAHCMSSFVIMLRKLRYVVSAVAEAEQWLIEDSYLSLDPERIYFDGSKRQVKLCLQNEPCKDNFGLRLCGLCRDAGKNGDLIADRLARANMSDLAHKETICRILAGWECDILHP